MIEAKVARRAFTLTLYHEPESDHIRIEIDPATPIVTLEDKRQVVRHLRAALAKLEDRIAWEHVSEITRTPMQGDN